MLTLQAINICLESLGQDPITSRDDGNYYVGSIEDKIESTRKNKMLAIYYFNTDLKTFTANDDGEIELASDEIGICFPVNLEDCLTIRSGKVWDREKRSWYGDSFTALVIKDIPFEQLPEAFAEWIARASAVAAVYKQDGVTPELQYAKEQAMAAETVALYSETYDFNSATKFGRLIANHNL